MDSHIEEMERLLNIHSNGVRIIGILGMGGLGKTTIAKVIYNQMCELFECHCFLEDVRENSNSNAIIKLQNQLVSQILKRESIFDDVNQGIDKIKGAIHRKKVLIVLDDVDKKFQIDKLAGNHSWYEAGSRIIITTRNEEVLLALEMTCQNEGMHELYKCYRPKLMDDNPALQLFSKYAFKEDSPPKGYDALAMEVVSSVGGLPLVLVTLGSLLFIEKDKVSWQQKLMKLQALPPPEVLGRLRISYDALDNAQQQIFLDIACFFSGKDKTGPYYMWDDCKFYPWEGINALVRRSLITMEDENRLCMHDRLRELGEQIICEKYWDEPEKWSRLWRSEDAWNILERHLEGTFTDVKLLRLESPVTVPVPPVPVPFSFVDVDEPRGRLGGQEFRKLPNLRYLSMGYIDLDGDFKNLLQNLRWLQWCDCPGRCAPTNLHLKNLLVLDISWGFMKDDWGGWSQIKMSNKLKVLDLSNCNDFTRIPHLSAFPALERLQLSDCSLLCRLDGLEELESLKYLDASGCYSLESLPDLSKLTSLQTLEVYACEELIEIQGLDKLESLEILDTSYCTALERLPNLSNLQKLTRFHSSWCEKLVEIQGLDRLASLERLKISGCKSLKSLPDLSNLENLTRFKSAGCKKLVEIQGLDRLASLEHLDISGCKSLKCLPHLSNFENLTRFKSSRCEKLVEGLDRLASLEHLDISGHKSLKSLPDLLNFKKLRNLVISSCDKLIDIQGLHGLESLEHLDMHKCKCIVNLPDFSNLTNLKKLDVSHCVKLTELRGLEELKFLKELRVVGCESLENLPNLPNTMIQKDSEDEVESSYYLSSDGSTMS